MKPQMKMIPLASLKIHPSNLLTDLDMKMIEQLTESMRREGFRLNHPLLVTRDYSILDGKHRYFAAVKAGIKDVPIVIDEATTDVEAMTATTIDNTFVNTLTRKLPKGMRVIHTVRKNLLEEKPIKEPWSLAGVNKSDWFAAKRVIDAEIQKASQTRKGLPIELLDDMIRGREISEQVFDLYHDEKAWNRIVKRTAAASTTPKGNPKPTEISDAINALTHYVKVSSEQDDSLPESLQTSVQSGLAKIKKLSRPDTARQALVLACEVTLSLLANNKDFSDRLF
ncbi:ParB/RepB/Spo0J family partition protein [Nitrospira lenta]|uniref:ParB-like N-terminal domain-containing protein n=1 Tax=Nitrospira lenta TaxID=1436998 RepID=A0A330L2H7_9BACT|nr:ParB/RepB/Spo0J family partition protein [Nitrospira lenta]SPP63968.1 hypothetical protein NITLEN_11054 [Nitrospira lenta]